MWRCQRSGPASRDSWLDLDLKSLHRFCWHESQTCVRGFRIPALCFVWFENWTEISWAWLVLLIEVTAPRPPVNWHSWVLPWTLCRRRLHSGGRSGRWCCARGPSAFRKLKCRVFDFGTRCRRTSLAVRWSFVLQLCLILCLYRWFSSD